MNIYIDTSSLFKLYHQEQGTDKIDCIFSDFEVTRIFLSQISKIEFASTVWKKVRVKEISADKAEKLLSYFNADYSKFSFVDIDDSIVYRSQVLLNKYGSIGLRTLDSIQFATAMALKVHCGLFVTDDKLLKSFFVCEHLPVY